MKQLDPVKIEGGNPAQVDAGPSPLLRNRRRLVAGLMLGVLASLGLAALVLVLRFAYRPDPEALHAEADQLIQQNRIDEAESLARRIERLRSPMTDDVLLRARLALARERDEEGIALLRSIPEDDPKAPIAYFRAGQVELRRDRVRKAEQDFLKAIQIQPVLDQARRELIYIYGYQLRRKAIGEQFRALSEPMRLTFSDVFLWCLLRRSTWQPEEASQTLARFVAADPEDRWSRIALIQNLITLRDFEAVERHLAALPEHDPEARVIRVRLALERGELETVERLLADDTSDHPDLHRYRGQIAMLDGDPDAAIEHFQAALDANPVDEGDLLRNLANCARMIGDDESAQRYSERASRFDRFNTLIERATSPVNRTDPALLRELGAACAAIDLDAEARAWYMLASAENPLDQDAQRGLAALE